MKRSTEMKGSRSKGRTNKEKVLHRVMYPKTHANGNQKIKKIKKDLSLFNTKQESKTMWLQNDAHKG